MSFFSLLSPSSSLLPLLPPASFSPPFPLSFLHISLLPLADLWASLPLTIRGKGCSRLLPSYAASMFPPGEMALPLSLGVSLPTPQGAGRPDLAVLMSHLGQPAMPAQGSLPLILPKGLGGETQGSPSLQARRHPHQEPHQKRGRRSEYGWKFKKRGNAGMPPKGRGKGGRGRRQKLQWKQSCKCRVGWQTPLQASTKSIPGLRLPVAHGRDRGSVSSYL